MIRAFECAPTPHIIRNQRFGLRVTQPTRETVEPAVDAVDVVSGDLQSALLRVATFSSCGKPLR